MESTGESPDWYFRVYDNRLYQPSILTVDNAKIREAARVLFGRDTSSRLLRRDEAII